MTKLTSTTTRTRTREALERLVRARLDADTFQREAIQHLRRAVPFDGYCWPLLDPASFLPTTALTDDSAVCQPLRRFIEIESLESDVNSIAALARGERRVGILSEATGGDCARSIRWDELLRTGGVGDELRAALVRDGICWGSLLLYRERTRSRFATEDGAYVRDVLGLLAEGIERGYGKGLAPTAPSDCSRDGPGVAILGPDLTLLSATQTATRWLGMIRSQPPDGITRPGRLAGVPLDGVIYALVARLRAIERYTTNSTDLVPRVRLRTRDGRWLVLHASRLAGAPAAGDVAIVIEPARPEEVLPLILRAYGLTARERELIQLVVCGLATGDIAGRLGISAYTVQDHLKAIFAKIGVRSRRALVARLAGLGLQLR